MNAPARFRPFSVRNLLRSAPAASEQLLPAQHREANGANPYDHGAPKAARPTTTFASPDRKNKDPEKMRSPGRADAEPWDNGGISGK
jgi:hypothetical protein